MKSEIAIIVHLLESDGSSLCAILNAVTLALVNAGIAMTDLLVSCSIGKLIVSIPMLST
jgi:exosome complex component RRP41